MNYRDHIVNISQQYNILWSCFIIFFSWMNNSLYCKKKDFKRLDSSKAPSHHTCGGKLSHHNSSPEFVTGCKLGYLHLLANLEF